MTERESKKPDVEHVSAEEIAVAFQRVIDEQQAGYGGQPRRKPVRARRIWSVFNRHKNYLVSLGEMAEVFDDTSDPRKSASSAISWINRTFNALGIDLEIESSTVYQIHHRGK